MEKRLQVENLSRRENTEEASRKSEAKKALPWLWWDIYSVWSVWEIRETDYMDKYVVGTGGEGLGVTPKSLTYGWVVFLSPEQGKIWWGIISGEGCKNQISVLNLTTLRPIQDFHIQIPHKKATVPERNSGPGDIFVKHLHVSEWYLTLDNWMKPPRDKAEKKLRMNLWEGH